MAGKISTTDVQRASAELAAMRGSLKKWLAFRAKNDLVLAGQARTKVPLPYAQRIVAASRDPQLEQDLADKLYALLSALSVPNLPSPSAPGAAVVLAQVAIAGQAAHPQAQGGIFGGGATPPWLWPVLIVGGLLIAITTAIKTAADVAKDKEEKACIQAGACTDYGFWLKAGGVIMIGWFAWREMGVGEVVKGFIQKRRS
jgi:hypothetical protein